jgi:hypothetical protein
MARPERAFLLGGGTDNKLSRSPVRVRVISIHSNDIRMIFSPRGLTAPRARFGAALVTA